MKESTKTFTTFVRKADVQSLFITNEMKIETKSLSELKIKKAALSRKFREFMKGVRAAHQTYPMKTIDLMSVSHYLAMLQKTELSKARTHIKELYLQNILEDRLLADPELDNNPFLKAYVQGTLLQLLEGLQAPPGFEDAALFLRKPRRPDPPTRPSAPLLKQPTAGSASKTARLKGHEVRLIQDAIIGRRKRGATRLAPQTRVQFASQAVPRQDSLGPAGGPVPRQPNSQEHPTPEGPEPTESRSGQLRFVVVKDAESPRRSSLFVGRPPQLKHQDTFDLPSYPPRQLALLSPSPAIQELRASGRELGSVEGQKSEDFEVESLHPGAAEPGPQDSQPSHLKSKSLSKQLLDVHSRYYLEKVVAKEEVEIELRQLQRRHSTRMPKLNFSTPHSKDLGSASLVPFSRRPSFDQSRLQDPPSLEEPKEVSVPREAIRRSLSTEEVTRPTPAPESHAKRQKFQPPAPLKDPSELHSKRLGLASTGFASHKHQSRMRDTFNFTTGSAGPAPRARPEVVISNFAKPSQTETKSHRATRSIGDPPLNKYVVSDSNPYEDYLPEASSGASARKPYSDLMQMRGKVTGFLRSIEYNTSINSNPNHLRKVHKLLQI